MICKRPKSEYKKFRILTTKRGVHAYLRILEPTEDPEAGSPPSCRICEDIKGWTANTKEIYKVRGIAVSRLGDGNGKRRKELEVKGNRGGSRTKGECKYMSNVNHNRWLHAAAQLAKNWINSECLKKFEE